ncbi:HepT-like ribonuclease domain-containing protein [Phormidium sp. CCY1219]|uniref:HepT-like ribonuclease domain-containing protein n=1 Tax=Phormidium sp. CCY1219 TaxID=2886104 RepID=UPI002D1EE24E|nr:DUF86 domain-containing protein [Phormidium sp. CCY1219]MEB3830787.1 DUF86 domain-containing protein [Phormidium sp. CCY1219]
MVNADAVRLQHMIDAAQKAIAFTNQRTREDLDRDEMLSLAVVRLVEILGEAAKNVSDSTKARSPDIPWRQMTGTRDRLTHAYFEVNLDIIWNIITNELPSLIPKLETLLAQTEE